MKERNDRLVREVAHLRAEADEARREADALTVRHVRAAERVEAEHCYCPTKGPVEPWRQCVRCSVLSALRGPP